MKIAICIPAKDTVHVGFALCLSRLTAQLERDNIDYDVNIEVGSVIAGQRNSLTNIALEKNATHILWLDSDMHFPSSIVKTFLKHNTDIVAANYSTRAKPYRSVAFTDPDNLDSRLDKKTGLHRVWAVGMGCMLVNTEVYKTLPKPWYQYIWNEDSQDLSGEDIYFCSQANNYNFEIYVDSNISDKVAHYGTKAFLINETVEFNRKI